MGNESTEKQSHRQVRRFFGASLRGRADKHVNRGTEAQSDGDRVTAAQEMETGMATLIASIEVLISPDNDPGENTLYREYIKELKQQERELKQDHR